VPNPWLTSPGNPWLQGDDDEKEKKSKLPAREQMGRSLIGAFPGIAKFLWKASPFSTDIAAKRGVAEGVADLPLGAAANLLEMGEKIPRIPVGQRGKGQFVETGDYDSGTAQKLRDFDIYGKLPGPKPSEGHRLYGRIGAELIATVAGARAIGKVPAVAGMKRVPREVTRWAPVDFMFGLDPETSGIAALPKGVLPDVVHDNPLVRAVAEASAFGAMGFGAERLVVRHEARRAARAAEEAAKYVKGPPTALGGTGKRKPYRTVEDAWQDLERQNLEAAETFTRGPPPDPEYEFIDDIPVMKETGVEDVDGHITMLEGRFRDDGESLTGARVHAVLDTHVLNGASEPEVLRAVYDDFLAGGRVDVGERLAFIMDDQIATTDPGAMVDALRRAAMTSPLDTTADDFAEIVSDELHVWGYEKGAGYRTVDDIPHDIDRFQIKEVEAGERILPDQPPGVYTEFRGRFPDLDGKITGASGRYDPADKLITVDGLGDPKMFWEPGWPGKARNAGFKLLRRHMKFLHRQFPEAEWIEFVRSGTTGGETGRNVRLQLRPLRDGGYSHQALMRVIASSGIGAAVGGAVDPEPLRGAGIGAAMMGLGGLGVRAAHRKPGAWSRRYALENAMGLAHMRPTELEAGVKYMGPEGGIDLTARGAPGERKRLGDLTTDQVREGTATGEWPRWPGSTSDARRADAAADARMAKAQARRDAAREEGFNLATEAEDRPLESVIADANLNSENIVRLEKAMGAEDGIIRNIKTIDDADLPVGTLDENDVAAGIQTELGHGTIGSFHAPAMDAIGSGDMAKADGFIALIDGEPRFLTRHQTTRALFGDEFELLPMEAMLLSGVQKQGKENVMKMFRQELAELKAGGFIDDWESGGVPLNIVKMIARQMGFAGAGAGVGAAIGGEEGAYIGAGVGFGAGILLGTNAARALNSVFMRGTRKEAAAAAKEIVDFEARQMEDMIKQGSLFTPADINPVAEVIIRSTEKNVDPEDIVNRLLARMEPKSLTEEDYAINRAAALALDPSEGRIDARYESNENLRTAALRAGLDVDVLETAIRRAPEIRVQAERAVLEMNEYMSQIVHADEVLAKMQGRVPQATLDEVQAARNTLASKYDLLGSEILRLGSQRGRDLQAMKTRGMAAITFDINNSAPWILHAQRLSHNKVKAVDIAKIRQALRTGDKAGMRDLMKQMETRGMNWGEKFSQYVKAGLLSAPKTDVINLGTAGLHTGLRNLSNPGAVMWDRLFEMGTKQRGVALKVPHGSILTLDRSGLHMGEGLKWGIHGNKQLGTQGFAGVWNAHGNVKDAWMKYDFRGLRTGNKYLDGYLQWGFVRLASEDAMMKGMIMHSSMTERARVIAMNAGLKKGTQPFKDEVVRLMTEMPDELTVPAMVDAEVMTFTNPSAVGEWINGFKQKAIASSPGGAIIAELGVPFVNTLVNVGASIFRFSPMGFMVPHNAKAMARFMNMMRTANGRKAISPAEQRKVAQLFSEAGMTGTALVWMGWKMREEGLMTGAFPSDEKKNLYSQANVQPLAFKVGGITVSLENVTPAGNVIGLGAMMYDVIHDPDFSPTIDNLAAGGFAAISNQLTELTFMSNVATAIEGFNRPERAGKAFGEQLGRMAIPTVIRQAVAAFDPVLREADAKGPVAGFLGGVVKTSPWSATLPPQIDRTTGQPRERSKLGQSLAGRLAENLLNPFRTSRINKDPIIRELTRLNVGVARLTTVQRRGITGDERAELEAIYGVNLHEWLQDAFADPQVQKLSDAGKKAYFDKNLALLRRAVTEALEEVGRLPPSEDIDPEDAFFKNIAEPMQGSGGGNPWLKP
jgi:hypothetical protein